MKHILSIMLSLLAFTLCCTSAVAQTLQVTLPDNVSHLKGTDLLILTVSPVNPDSTHVIGRATYQGGATTIRCDIADTQLPCVAVLRFDEPDPTHFASPISPQILVDRGKVHVDVTDNTTVRQSGGKSGLVKDWNARHLTPMAKQYADMRAINAERNAIANITQEQNEAYNARLQEVARTYTGSHALYTLDLYRQGHQHIADALYFSIAPSMYPADMLAQLQQRVTPSLLAAAKAKMEARQRRQQEFADSKRTFGIGSPMRDINAFTPDGTPVSLASLTQPNHATLLIFWASWCAPCRQEIPFFRSLYEQYHDRGLDIVSCSLDSDEASWRRALDKENMPWPQMSDLKAFNGTITQTYGVQAIPFVVLFDRQSRVAVLNQHAHLLETAIRHTLGIE